MLVSRDDIHEITELDPEYVREREEFRFGFFVEKIDVCLSEEGRWFGLRHAVAKLAPEGATVDNAGRKASPSSVWENVSIPRHSGKAVPTLRKIQVFDCKDWCSLDVCNPLLLRYLRFAAWIKLLSRDRTQG